MSRTFDKIFADEKITIGVKYHGNNFIVGPDNELIKLKKMYYDPFSFLLKHPDSVSVTDIWSILDKNKKPEESLFGLMHLINCSFDNPINFQSRIAQVRT